MSLIEFSNFPVYSNFLSFGREKFCKNIKFELSPSRDRLLLDLAGTVQRAGTDLPSVKDQR